MELRRIVWEWDTALARMADDHPGLAAALARSCRPLAAERRPDGRLRLVLGCWWEADMQLLLQPMNEAQLGSALSSVLDDQMRVTVERWPAGMAASADDEAIRAPDVLAGLPLQAREEAFGCESTLQKHFYAEAYRRGLRRIKCQYPVLNYRLDFAVPSQQVAAEVEGWEPPAGVGGRVPRREREQHLGSEGWRVLRFWGAEVLRDAAACVDELRGALR